MVRRLGATATLLLILATAVLVLGGALAVVLLATVDETPADVQEANEAADVAVVRCRDARGQMSARVRVTNNSSLTSDYYIDVDFTWRRSGNVVEVGSGIVEDLAPGESVPVVVTSVARAPRAFDCRVADVDRLAA